MLEKANPILARFAEAFPLREVEVEKKKRKRHWRDYLDEGERGLEVDETLKQLKSEAAERDGNGGEEKDGIISFDDVVQRQVDHVTSTDPVGTVSISVYIYVSVTLLQGVAFSCVCCLPLTLFLFSIFSLSSLHPLCLARTHLLWLLLCQR